MLAKEIERELFEHQLNCRSQWDKGVAFYADWILSNCTKEGRLDLEVNSKLETILLGGVSNWYEASYQGYFFKDANDICALLCTASEQQKKDYGRLAPNKQETWYSVQAKALTEASKLIRNIIVMDEIISLTYSKLAEECSIYHGSEV